MKTKSEACFSGRKLLRSCLARVRQLKRVVAITPATMALVAIGWTFSIGAAGAAAYQENKSINCPNGPNCRLVFSAVPATKRLDVQFVSCLGSSSASYGAVHDTVSLGVPETGATVLRQFLLARDGGQNSGEKFFTVSQSAPLAVSAGKSAQVFVTASEPADRFSSLSCTIFGSLVNAATVAPFQQRRFVSCPNGPNCRVVFPTIPASKRFDISFVSCLPNGATKPLVEYTLGWNETATKVRSHFLVPRDFGGANTISQAVRLSVPGSKAPFVFIRTDPATGGRLSSLECTIYGALVSNTP